MTPARTACPYAAELGAATGPETAPSVSRHLAECARCRADRAAYQRIAELARALPWRAPDAEGTMAAKARLLSEMVSGRPARVMGRRWMRAAVYLGAILFAASAAAVVGTRAYQSRRGAVAQPGRATTARRPRPAVTPVPPLPAPGPPPAPRRVQRPRATAGLHDGSRAAVLPPPAELRPPPTTPAGPDQLAYAEGWQAMRAGDHDGAADAMARVLALSPGAPLAEDALYWNSVALGRAHRDAEARTAMEKFLRQHRDSSRAGEISVMLGWLLVDARELRAAEARFRDAENHPRRAVRESARAGLAALAR